MSLEEVMTALANEIEQDRQVWTEIPSEVHHALMGYIRVIRTAVKMSRSSAQKSPGALPAGSGSPSDLVEAPGAPPMPESVRRAMERQQQRLSMGSRTAVLEEKVAEPMVQFVGGDMDGVVAPVSGDKPLVPGATIRTGGQNYVFRDGCFHHTP